MPDTTLTSAELAEALANLTDAFLKVHGRFPLDRVTPEQEATHLAMKEAYRLIGQPGTNDRKRKLSLARAGIEAGKAEESMRERAATVADDMRDKFGSPTGDAYSNGLWDQGVRIATAIRALPLTGVDKP